MRQDRVCVKAPVFPFIKLRGLDPAPGPEMKSTGEVFGSRTNGRRRLPESTYGHGDTDPSSRGRLSHGP